MALTMPLLDLEAYGEGVARAFPSLKVRVETLGGVARAAKSWGGWLGLAVARKISSIRVGRSYVISYNKRTKQLGECPKFTL
jgi:hypothetical protein